MDASTRISIVVPCFNHGQYLAEAVASVIGLGRRDIEGIVVDDGSTDERTRSEMERLQQSGVRVIRQENRGLAAARNAGVLASRGEYIFPLDADDRMGTGWLDRAIKLLECDPKAGIVYGDAQCFGAKTSRWRTGVFDAQRLLTWNFIHASSLYRRQVWDENGGYDGTMPVQGFEDWDFWLGALEHGWEFAYLPEVFFDYRQHEVSMLTRATSHAEEVADFVARKHGSLYRRVLLSLLDERRSVKRSSRHVIKLARARLEQKLGRRA